VLRPDLLAGSALVVARPVAGRGEFGEAVKARLVALGAAVDPLEVDPFGDEPEFARAADGLVWDGSGAFEGEVTVESVRACADGAWLAVRTVANAALTPGGGGPVVLVAPRPGNAHHAAARAALENLARTLSIEWARLGIRPVAIHPGAGVSADAVAELTAFLLSRAGEYYSGTVLTLQ
jgi:hypothetical protein